MILINLFTIIDGFAHYLKDMAAPTASALQCDGVISPGHRVQWPNRSASWLHLDADLAVSVQEPLLQRRKFFRDRRPYGCGRWS